MSNLRARIARLERAIERASPINWDNLWRRREDVVPDGVIDWDELFVPPEPWSPETCPIERAIAAALCAAATPLERPGGGTPPGRDRSAEAPADLGPD